MVSVGAVWNVVLLMIVGVIAGTSGSRLVQYAGLAVWGVGQWLIGVHSGLKGQCGRRGPPSRGTRGLVIPCRAPVRLLRRG